MISRRFAVLALAQALALAAVPGICSRAAAGGKDAEPELFPRAKRLCTIQAGFGMGQDATPVLYATPNGLRLVATVSEKDPQEIIRNLPIGKFVPGQPPPGVKEVLANPTRLKMWDAVTGKELDPPGKDLGLFDFKYECVSPDGTKRVKIEDLDLIGPMGGFPQPGPGVTKPFRYKVTLLDLQTNKALYTVNPFSGWGRPIVRFAPDSSFVVLIGDSEMTVHKPGAEKPTQKFKFVRKLMQTPYGVRPAPLVDTNSFVMSPDGLRLGMSVDGAVRIFDLGKGSVLFEVPSEAKTAGFGFDPNSMTFAFNPSMKDRLLLVGRTNGAGGDFRLFDMNEKKEKGRAPLPGKNGPGGAGGLAGLLFRPPQAYFTAKDEPRGFYVEQGRYDAANKNFPFTGKFLDAATGNVTVQFESKGHHRYMLSLDGKYLIRTSFDKERFEGRRTVEVWDAEQNGAK
jgi:hypothetical protein